MAYVSPVSAGNDDSNDREVGVEWVGDYSSNPDNLSNLPFTDDEATAFYNRLGDLGWTKRFNPGDSAAWESHFEKSTVGGIDTANIDAVDFAYFSGHGSPSAFHFGTDHDGDGTFSWMVDYREVEWGNTDLEWIVLSACQCLEVDGIFGRWGSTSVFKGLHGILGFHTYMYDTSTLSNRFVDYMIGHRAIAPSWMYATWDDQPSDVYGAYVSADDPRISGTSAVVMMEFLPGYGWNDLASSLKVSGSVTLYEDVNYGGASRTFTGDVPNLVDYGWNDRASSLKVSGSVTLYEHINYGGASINLGVNLPSLDVAPDTTSGGIVYANWQC